MSKNFTCRLALIFAAGVALSMQPLHAVTYYVDRDANGADDGSSWEDAYPILQDAIAVAGAGDEIWVAWGIYYPDEGAAQTDNDRDSNFKISNGVSIFGGFAGHESAVGERKIHFYKSILSGDLQQDDDDADSNGISESINDINGQNAYHVVTGGAVPAGCLLDGFTITGGAATGIGNRSGGGIRFDNGAFSVRNCHLIGNYADMSGGAAMLSDSTAAFTNCLFSGNFSNDTGGAVFSSNSRLIFTNSALLGNVSTFGGGVAFEGQGQKFVNCSLSGNSAISEGGAIYATGGTTVVDLANTVIWNNAADGSVKKLNSSFTLVAGAGMTADFSLAENILFAGGVGNFDGTDPGNDPLFDEEPDPAAAPSSAGDLRLQPDSPVGDSGSNAAIGEPRDLAGRLRIINSQPGGGAVVDLGAYEIQTPIYVDASATGSGSGLNWADAIVDLQDALAAANAGSEIRVASGTYFPDMGAGQINNDEGATFQLMNDVALLGGYQIGGSVARDPLLFRTILSGDIDMNDTYTGSLVRSTAGLSGANSDTIVTATGADRSAILDGFYINAGQADGSGPGGGDGAGLYADAGSPCVINCQFLACRSVSGGAVYLASGSHATFGDCSFDDNSTTIGSGGALNIRPGAAPGFSSCSFSDNESLSGGAAFIRSNTSNDQFQTMFLNCAFSGNMGGRAGAIHNFSATYTTVRGCSFVGNSATENGGAIFCASASNGLIADSTFTDNSANDDGGAICNVTSRPRIFDCVFTNNDAGERAGALMAGSFSPSAITRCQFIGNTSGTRGGATFMWDLAEPVFTDCLFEGNHSTTGGGAAYCSSGIAPVFTRCQFVDNSASDEGGAVKVRGADALFTNCAFQGNRSDVDGGGVHLSALSTAMPRFTNCLFAGNLAENGGAIANLSGAESEFINCTVAGNVATSGGGALHVEDGTVGLANTILWHNSAAGSTLTTSATIARLGSGTAEFYYSLVANSGGSASWDGAFGTNLGANIDVLPVFVVPVDLAAVPTTAGDLRLVVGSPGIDDGRNSINSEPLDLAGNARVMNLTIDMGAYEGGVTLTDSDGDSLPNQWEKMYSSNGSSVSIAPGDDTDGDGLSAWFEFLHGLDPNTPNDPADAGELGVRTAVNGDEFLTLSFRRNPASIGFLSVSVERSTNLDPRGWDVSNIGFQSIVGDILTYGSKVKMPQAREFLRIKLQ